MENKLKAVRASAAVDKHAAAVESFTSNVVRLLEMAAENLAGPSRPLIVTRRELSGALISALKADAATVDQRNQLWRVRLRLYDMQDPNDPRWDSDPTLDPREPGAEVIAGLPEVAVAVGAAAVMYHGGQCVGLDHTTLMHRLKSLRPTLSRRKGNARWRIPYQAPDCSEWTAVATIERIDTGENHGENQPK